MVRDTKRGQQGAGGLAHSKLKQATLEEAGTLDLSPNAVSAHAATRGKRSAPVSTNSPALANAPASDPNGPATKKSRTRSKPDAPEAAAPPPAGQAKAMRGAQSVRARGTTKSATAAAANHDDQSHMEKSKVGSRAAGSKRKAGDAPEATKAAKSDVGVTHGSAGASHTRGKRHAPAEAVTSQPPAKASTAPSSRGKQGHHQAAPAGEGEGSADTRKEAKVQQAGAGAGPSPAAHSQHKGRSSRHTVSEGQQLKQTAGAVKRHRAAAAVQGEQEKEKEEEHATARAPRAGRGRASKQGPAAAEALSGAAPAPAQAAQRAAGSHKRAAPRGPGPGEVGHEAEADAHASKRPRTARTSQQAKAPQRAKAGSKTRTAKAKPQPKQGGTVRAPAARKVRGKEQSAASVKDREEAVPVHEPAAAAAAGAEAAPAATPRSRRGKRTTGAQAHAQQAAEPAQAQVPAAGGSPSRASARQQARKANKSTAPAAGHEEEEQKQVQAAGAAGDDGQRQAGVPGTAAAAAGSDEGVMKPITDAEAEGAVTELPAETMQPQPQAGDEQAQAGGDKAPTGVSGGTAAAAESGPEPAESEAVSHYSGPSSALLEDEEAENKAEEASSKEAVESQPNAADTSSVAGASAAADVDLGAPPADSVEEGRCFFLYRPRVANEHPQGFNDVARFHMLLAPDGGARPGNACRDIVVGKKRLPDAHKHERFFGFVAAVSPSLESLVSGLGEESSETKTRGTRVTPAARLAAAGRYTILDRSAAAPDAAGSTKQPRSRSRARSGTELLYELQLPLPPLEWLLDTEAGAGATGEEEAADKAASSSATAATCEPSAPVQRELCIPPSARFVLSIKNPANKRPGLPSAGPEPQYTQEQVEALGTYAWIPAHDPSMLDMQGTEVLLVGARAAPPSAARQPAASRLAARVAAELLQQAGLPEERGTDKPSNTAASAPAHTPATTPVAATPTDGGSVSANISEGAATAALDAATAGDRGPAKAVAHALAVVAADPAAAAAIHAPAVDSTHTGEGAGAAGGDAGGGAAGGTAGGEAGGGSGEQVQAGGSMPAEVLPGGDVGRPTLPITPALTGQWE